jgi:hypothetical protein
MFEIFIATQNIANFKALISVEKDPERLRMLMGLLVREQDRLSAEHVAKSIDSSRRQPIADEELD